MRVKNLKLKNFRLIKEADLNLNSNKIIILGNNGYGKTTIVEALYYCCFLTSFRINKRSELITFDEDILNVDTSFEVANIENNLKIYVNSENQNIVYNGHKNQKRIDVLGKIKVLFLSPSSDEYVSGSPKIRRKFLNIYLSQYDDEFAKLIAKYENISKQRSKILKEDKVDDMLLDIVTKQYDELNQIIKDKRKIFLQTIQTHSSSVITMLSSSYEKVELIYKESVKVDIAKEKRYQKNLYGAQHDDFEILLNGKEAKKYASQGQKRSLSIALILSQLELINQKYNDYPIVIIDDVHIELDEKRQMILFEILDEKIQTFFISTNLKSIPEYIEKKAIIYRFEDYGILEKQE